MASIPRPWLNGRPILDPEKKRNKTVMVKLTPGEFEQLKKMAEEQITYPSTLAHTIVVRYLQENQNTTTQHR